MLEVLAPCSHMAGAQGRVAVAAQSHAIPCWEFLDYQEEFIASSAVAGVVQTKSFPAPIATTKTSGRLVSGNTHVFAERGAFFWIRREWVEFPSRRFAQRHGRWASWM